MLIKRILVASALMLGALHAHAASDGTDSHCIVGKNNSLFNQCNYSVDVGFCVENPRQTKHFYDNSKAFECPGGALIALPAGLEDGNILHGKVHWWACSIKHRAGNKWRYVEGVGYRGYCFKEGANQAQPVRNSAPAAPTATADCQALENRLQGPNPTTHQMRRAQALTALEYVDRNCGGQSPQQRARVRKASQETLIAAAAECKQSGGRNCDSSNDIPESRSTAQRPVAESGGVSAGRVPARGEPSVEMLMSRCSEVLKTTIDVKYQGEVDGDSYYGRNHTGSRERVQRWVTEAARADATSTLAIPPNSLVEYHAGALREAESRAKPMQNGLHDTHRESALLRACFIKARIDSR